ncbi:MAG: radical SAM protein [Clostridia bacterium]|nr:radical SAM protein [Clostridia bacterium]
MAECTLCPRQCGADRALGELGFCGESNRITVSRASLHMWEEPPISGARGSGTIFFCGCNLKCVFCQNRVISSGGGVRRELNADELSELMLELEAAGAHNINLVTPTHFSDSIALSLEQVRHKLKIPIVYNSSGYESLDALKRLDGLVDVYLPDFKYASPDLAKKYSSAPDYPEVALAAVSEMFRQVGECLFDDGGLMKKGLIVRHLVLPACRHDSMNVLSLIADTLPVKSVRLSLMSQYTPEFALTCEYKNLHRKLTSFEYNSVLAHAESLGFDGYFQALSSASSQYTPNFEEDADFIQGGTFEECSP